jgi:hypothetical protein
MELLRDVRTRICSPPGGIRLKIQGSFDFKLGCPGDEIVSLNLVLHSAVGLKLAATKDPIKPDMIGYPEKPLEN